MSNGKFEISQVGYSTPFDNDTNGFIAEDVQTAIEEVSNKVSGKPRAIVAFAYNGTANTGKWLETFASIPSDQVPYVAAEPSVVKALSLVNNGSTTATVTLYRNGVSVQTLSLTAQTYNIVSGLSISLAAGQSLSAQVTANNMSKPAFFVSIEVNL